MIPWAVLGVAVPLAVAAGRPAPPPGLPLRLESADAQYDYARRLHRSGSAAKGVPRWLAMEQALRAYRAVEFYWPSDGDSAAEAAYRRGEIERTLDRAGRALAAFETVVGIDADPDWGARARLEMATLYDRRGEPADARRRLLEVVSNLQVSPHWRNRARERYAEQLLKAGRPEAAYSAATAWLPEVSSTREQVRAVDLQARARLMSGRSAEAAALLAALDEEVVALTSYPGEEAAALRRALADMQSRSALSSDSEPGPQR